MSNAEASGQALDATAQMTESHDGELERELAAIDAELSDQERQRLERRAEVGRRLYDQRSAVVGTHEHTAHGEQLARLRDDAARAHDAAQKAARRAEEHAAGKQDAVREAATALDSAELALAEFAGSAE
jgi:hypothetical protein